MMAVRRWGAKLTMLAAALAGLSLVAGGPASGAPAGTKSGKATPDLRRLGSEYAAHLARRKQGLAGPVFRSANTLAPTRGGTVVIDAVADAPRSAALAAALRDIGATQVTTFGRITSARLPMTAIPTLEGLADLRLARPAYAATRAGSVTSQGDAAIRADAARAAFGVNGAGVTVGTLSDSYDCRGGAAAGVASGDLPSGVVVLDELNDCAEGSDEGRAMMEIIHDAAPGAAQAFHTAFEGQASFAQGIIDLADAGANVINDDVIYYGEPFYQDGIVARAVDAVRSRGVSYFSSAGNEGRQAYEAPFRRSGLSFNDLGFGPQEAHDFDPGPLIDTCQRISLPAGQTLVHVFQWDQPFASVSGAPGSASDIDIAVYGDPECLGGAATVVASQATGNTGGDPIEVLQYTNPGPVTVLGLRILHYEGPYPGRMKVVDAGAGSFAEHATATGTSWGHSAAAGGLGVGAANYPDTPAFGTSPPAVASYSSAGGTPILFDTAGNRLPAPQIRPQPDVTAPDAVDTTFFGTNADSTPAPNFFGTSAAAPHAAAAAALIVNRFPSITPDAVYAALRESALDMDDPSTSGFDTGTDFATGAGLIQADRALGSVADLSLAMTGSPDPQIVGGTVTYSIVVTNTGPSPAGGITITDTLPSQTTLVSATASQGSCGGGGRVSCTIGALPAGGSATVTIVATATAAGTAVNGAAVAGADPDPDQTNNARSVATTVTAPGAPAAPAPPPPLPPPATSGVVRAPAFYCGGVRATIVGTRGGEILTGTPRRDVIAALGGNDVINGRGGNDLICAGTGNDLIRGGMGKDVLRGEAGRDVLVGGSGADRLLGATGDDRLRGDAGRDVCVGGPGTRDRAAGCETLRSVP